MLGETGKTPVRVKWAGTDNGNEEELSIRCRLVARDFRVKGYKDREDILRRLRRWNQRGLCCPGRPAEDRWKGKEYVVYRSEESSFQSEGRGVGVHRAPTGGNGGKNSVEKVSFWLHGFRQAAQAGTIVCRSL